MSSIVGTFSGDVEGSVGTIDSDITTLQGQVPSAAGFDNWNTIYGDRNNIRSVSGSVAASDTAFLNGATPTLTNNLNADGNSINAVPIIYGNDNLTLQSKNSSQRGEIVINDPLDANENSISGVTSVHWFHANDPSGSFFMRRVNDNTTTFFWKWYSKLKK